MLRLFAIFLRLGCIAFGGPVAHLSLFHEEFVRRRRWLDEERYADLIALCQFLPGPASSQAGMAIGWMRGGYAGALIAWIAFTAPAAISMTLTALAIASGLGGGEAGGAPAWSSALDLVVVAVVAQAVWAMGRHSWLGRRRLSIGIASASLLLLFPALQLPVIAAGAVAGLLWLREPKPIPGSDASRPPSSPLVSGAPLGASLGTSLGTPGVLGPWRSIRTPAFWIALFALFLVALPIAAARFPSPAIELADSFYRTGSLVFGGGHVVLPLLQSETVATAKVDHDTFLAGYGIVQAIPGPLFSFAAFLGASVEGFEARPVGALIALVAIFAPSFFLVFGVLPSWERLRGKRSLRAALAGVNAAVVGLLLAVLCNPIVIESVRDPADGLGALLALALLYWGRWPPWSVVGLFALGGALLPLA